MDQLTAVAAKALDSMEPAMIYSLDQAHASP